MQYHNITKDDMLNGDGLRVVLWVAGCGHALPRLSQPDHVGRGTAVCRSIEAAKEEIFTELAQGLCLRRHVFGRRSALSRQTGSRSARSRREVRAQFSGKDHLAVYRLPLGGDCKMAAVP